LVLPADVYRQGSYDQNGQGSPGIPDAVDQPLQFFRQSGRSDSGIDEQIVYSEIEDEQIESSISLEECDEVFAAVQGIPLHP
jgi:hypothetical protein